MADLAGAPTAQELAARTGYDPAFLGPGVPMPGITTGAATVLLPYLHYSVLFRPDRKFAAVTALDLDGACLQTIARTDKWLFDPRLSRAAQAGPPRYLDNDLDRGHPVMRASSAWGSTEDEARQVVVEVDRWSGLGGPGQPRVEQPLVGACDGLQAGAVEVERGDRGELPVGTEQHRVVQIGQQHGGCAGGDPGHGHAGAEERRVVARPSGQLLCRGSSGQVCHGGTLGPRRPGAP